MTVRDRRWWLAGLLGAILLTGCDLGSLTYFMCPENREDPEYRPLVIKDKSHGLKVAVLVYSPLEIQAHHVQLDRQLGEMLGEQIQTLARENRDKIQVLPARTMEDFKNNHPSWKSMDAADIGRSVGVDYIISLEINKFSLVEPGTQNMLLRGQCQVSVSLVEVAHPDDTPIPKEWSFQYPTEGPKPDFDCTREEFRQQYLTQVARRLSYFFIPHPKRDRMVD